MDELYGEMISLRQSFRRRSLLMLLSTSNSFREQLLFLRKRQNTNEILSASNYFTILHSELSYVLKQSFEEDYRKLADFLSKLFILTVFQSL